MTKPVTHTGLKQPVLDSVWFIVLMVIVGLFALSFGITALLYLFL